jgi:hypothetical protein
MTEIRNKFSVPRIIMKGKAKRDVDPMAAAL